MADKKIGNMTDEEIFQSIIKDRTEQGITIDANRFITPDMGDYSQNSMSLSAFKELEKTLDPNSIPTGMGAMYYNEDPPSTTLGYDPNLNIFVLKATPLFNSKYGEAAVREKNLHSFDGDTIYFDYDSIQDGDSSFTIGTATYSNVKTYIDANSTTKEMIKKTFGLRFVGMNAPEIPHYALFPAETVDKKDTGITIVETTLGDIKNSPTYIYRKMDFADAPDSTKMTFIQFANDQGTQVFHEWIKTHKDFPDKFTSDGHYIDYNDSGKEVLSYLCTEIYSDAINNDDYASQGMKARNDVYNMLTTCEDMIVIMDAQEINKSSMTLPQIYLYDFLDQIYLDVKHIWDSFLAQAYPYLGYNSFGQDMHKRFLGCVYFKQGGKWINLNKYLISKYNKIDTIPDYKGDPMSQQHFWFVSDAFKLWTYDSVRNARIVDSLSEMTREDIDDRNNIQKQIMGRDFDYLKSWTVMLGDCLFMVPPTSIRAITQMTNEKVPLMRANGSMIKGSQKTIRDIELTLYFNKEGINGVEYKDSKDRTYFMNGLRALIAQFKKTPFLPIENDYINKVLNIEAVTMVNMQIQTIPGYPRCLSAVLTLQEFDYRAYMPEIPIPDAAQGQDIHMNMFAKTIDFEVMRWYYQQSILAGEKVKGMDANDPKYLNATFGERSVLQPMTFGNSNIDFYIPDTDKLEKMLQLKVNALAYPLQSSPTVSDAAKKWISDLGKVYVKLAALSSDSNFTNALKNLNKSETINNKKYELVYDQQLISSGGAMLNTLSSTGMEKAYSACDTKSGKDFVTSYVTPIFNIIQDKLTGPNGTSVVSGFTVEESYTGKGNTEQENKDGQGSGTVSWDIILKIDTETLGDVDSKAAVTEIFKSMGLDITKDTDYGSVFDSNWNVKLNLSCAVKYDVNNFNGSLGVASGFNFNTTSGGFSFLKRCAATSQLTVDSSAVSNESQSIDTSNVQNMQDYLTAEKENLDLESASTLTFNKYPIEDLKVESVAAVMSNTLARISVQAIDGYAPQYLGGQDTALEVTFSTTNKATVTLLQQLPKLAAQYARDYRLVLSFWPLRIDSEITRLLGINEVIIENVGVDTIPGTPGMFKVTMRLMSVDRTLRNKEALKKIDTAANNGSISTTSKGSLVEKSYFDLQKSLGQTEVYPDLELPTIDELAANGFRFIRYSGSTSNRVYPDPDFYFVYAHILGSEMFRDTVLNFFKDADWKDKTQFDLSDVYGAKISIKQDDKKVFTTVAGSENAAATTMKNNMKTSQDGVNELIKQSSTSEGIVDKDQKKNTNVSYESIITAAAVSSEYQMWNIADEVKVMFREKKYIKDLTKDTNKSNNKYADELDMAVQKVIDLIDLELAKPMAEKNVTLNRVSSTVLDTSHITDFVNDFFGANDWTDTFNSSVGYKIIEALCPDSTARDGVIKEMGNIIMAAACGYSAEKLYDGSKSSTDWKPRPYVSIKGKMLGSDDNPIPLCKVSVANQGVVGANQASSFAEALMYGIEFGMFGTKLYPVEFMKKICPTEASTFNGDKFFIDPYYRSAQIDGDTTAVKDYKTKILLYPYYSAYAFTRNMLFWLKKMLTDKVLYSMYDIIGEKSLDYITSLSANDPPQSEVNQDKYSDPSKNLMSLFSGNSKPASTSSTSDNTEATIKGIKNILQQSRKPLAVGKIVSSCIMTLLSGDNFMYGLMKNRNYDQLDSVVKYINTATLPFEGGTKNANMFAKFINALAGSGTIKKQTSIGNSADTVDSFVSKIIDERIWLKEADSPYTYMLHSFYDMVMNDKRGRMLRAFPTFYMMFIDEGRDIGLWKLNDNFYGVNAISEVQVTRSRKIAADTASITMSNMFKTFNTDDEDLHLGYNDYTWKDAFNSIFSPKTYYVKEELKRLSLNAIERTTLRAGVRIHMRIGYGADASTLPIAFNGCIAEVSAGDVVEIVAQGDGVELSNPLLSSADAEDVQNQDEIIISRMWKDWITHGATPRTILSSLLTTKGGFIPKAIYNYTNGRFFNRNPYGIVHFGEPEYKTIFQNGECTQNIYEGSQKPNWGEEDAAISGTIREEYVTEDAPKISCHIFGKSYWDIMQICASAAPDYIASIAPFGVRSTIFYGSPRFYYAYEYVKDKSPDTGEEVIKEKRKPYQQYHIYTSYSDIIGNAIKTSEMDVRTCAVGLYQQSQWLGSQSPKRVGPMWVDYDIYPEKQKTMTVDTQYLAKGSAMGDIIPFMNWIANELGKDPAGVGGGYQTAWRMTASALKNSVKDMYQGDLMVIGDPAVKPYDKAWVEDIYERMQGCFEVEATVNNLSVENGYTTSIYPDCIATIDDKYEQISHHILSQMTSKYLAVYSSTVLLTSLFAGRTRPLIGAVAEGAAKFNMGASKFVDMIGNIVGKTEMSKSEGFLKTMGVVNKTLGIDSNSIAFRNYIDKLKKYRDFLPDFGNTSSFSDLSTKLEKMASSLEDLDPNSALKTLGDMDTTLYKGSTEAITASKTELEAGAEKYAANVKNILSGIDSSNVTTAEDILTRLKAVVVDDTGEKQRAIDEVLTKLKGMNDGPTTAEELKSWANANKILADNMDVIKASEDLMKDANTFLKDSLVNVKGVFTKSISKVAGEGLTSLADIAITKGSNLAKVYSLIPIAEGGILASAAMMALEAGVITVMTSFVYEYIERWMKNLQVVQVFPLKKDSKVYTAGLDGSRGAVVGSPTESDPGLIEGMIGQIMQDKQGGPYASLYNFVKNLIVSQNMQDIADNYLNRTGMSDTDGATARQSFLDDLLTAATADEMRSKNSYNAMLLQPRVTVFNSSDGKDAFNKYAVLDASNITKNTTITGETVPASKIPYINNLMSNKTFILEHDQVSKDGSGDKRYAELLNFNIESQDVAVNVIHETDGIIDTSFLRPEAWNVVVQLLTKLNNAVNKDASLYSTKDYFKTHPILFKSGLRVGDNKSWASTGYYFKLQVANSPEFKTAIESTASDVQDLMKSLNKTGQLFSWKAVDEAQGIYQFVINPPLA